MTVDEAYGKIRHAIDTGRPAHGYLIVGGVRTMGGELAARVLARLFGDGDLRAHPDIHRLYPEKKTRIISVESMRAKMIDPMESTAFQGGWKAGVIYGAERLRTESANAFLKTLEEPPPKTLFLLLTEQPEQLLPTIISRCQRIDLPDAGARWLEEPYRGELLAILASDNLVTAGAKAAAAARAYALLKRLEARAAELVDEDLADEKGGPGAMPTDDEYKALVSSRYREYRTEAARVILSWFRDLMAVKAAPRRATVDGDEGQDAPVVNERQRGVLEARARRITLAQTFRNIQAVEEFAASLDRNLQEEAMLAFLFDRAAFGAEGAAR